MMTSKPDRMENSATLLLALVPVVLKDLRAAGDFGTPSALTVPQLRTLTFIGRHPGCTLGHVAAHLGIGLPSASASVSRLCKKGLLALSTPPEDRRSTSLEVTAPGLELVQKARLQARERISQRLRSLSASELRQVEESLALLKNCFTKL